MKPLIVALDMADMNKALKLVVKIGKYVDIFKVNHSLFMRYGDTIIKSIHKKRKKIFLDLKFHDIPNTVESALKAAGELGVYAISVHIAGGLSMLERILAVKKRPKIWGITMLTSIDMNAYRMLGHHDAVKDQVMRLARLGASVGIDGIVCSPAEVSLLNNDPEAGNKGVLFITPGIRPGNVVSRDDQKRAATPKQAINDGADFIVVGRPILEAADPVQVVKEIYKELK